MDPVIFEDVANSLIKLRFYPYFDVSHYILMSIAVKEDTPQSGSANFSRRHPFACWLATMLMCFGGAILTNFVCGSPLFLCFDDTRAVLTATVVWYLINYCPFDLVYRLVKFLPLRLMICSLKEIQRSKKIALGVQHGLHEFPDSAVMCVLLGLLKGSGAILIRPASEFVLGIMQPGKNPLLVLNSTTKISLLAAIAYYAQHWGLVPLSANLLFLAVSAVLVYLRVTMILLGLKDPFKPFENIICTIFFGGTVDAIRDAFDRSRAARRAAAAAAATSSTRGSATSTIPGSPSFASAGSATGTTNLHGASSSSVSNTATTGSPSNLVNGQTGLRESLSRPSTDKKRD